MRHISLWNFNEIFFIYSFLGFDWWGGFGSSCCKNWNIFMSCHFLLGNVYFYKGGVNTSEVMLSQSSKGVFFKNTVM